MVPSQNLGPSLITQVPLKELSKLGGFSYFSKYLNLLKKYACLVSGGYQISKSGKFSQKRRKKNVNLIGKDFYHF